MATGAEEREADAAAEELLQTAELSVEGAMADASNATLYTTLRVDGERVGAAIYKPVSGERPLWDFPHDTLYLREVATYRLARLAGLDVVPPTVLRDGPFGLGSVQLWVGPGPDQQRPGAGVIDICAPQEVPPGWRIVLRARDDRSLVVLCHADDPRLAAMAVLDILANNADRKGGHILGREADRIAGVDHGLTFNTEPKLRTVLWGWTGEPVPEPLLAAVDRVLDGLTGSARAEFAELLAPDELAALVRRCRRLVRSGCFPGPSGHTPAIPWPAF